MLSKVASEFPNDWDKYLPAVLFAYKETLHRVTGHSSYELIFGSSLRGLLSSLRDMCIRPDIPKYQTYNSYLSNLRQRIIKGCQFARKSLAIAGENQSISSNL